MECAEAFGYQVVADIQQHKLGPGRCFVPQSELFYRVYIGSIAQFFTNTGGKKIVRLAEGHSKRFMTTWHSGTTSLVCAADVRLLCTHTTTHCSANCRRATCAVTHEVFNSGACYQLQSVMYC
jgi:hypothetical protein